jgi:hypothetical protein
MGPIDAHSFSDGLLAETRLRAKSANVVSEHLSNIHPKDGHHSRILALRIIIRGLRARARMAEARNAEIAFPLGKMSTFACINHPIMPTPPDPPIADAAPTQAQVTDYDRMHLTTYLRLLDAASEGAPWEDVARIVLDLDPAREPDRARKAHETHLARARWLTAHGYRGLLRS